MDEYKEPHFAKKHPADRKPKEEVIAAIREKSLDNEMPCAVAFDIAAQLKVEPSEVGFAADYLELRLVKCQLGLFGYKPQKSIVKPSENVPPLLEQAIREQLVDGRLPCKHAWAIASKLGLRKMEVSSACETLGIKITACQLGAF
ncbi:MAG: hypothetical protein JRH08_04365 [Deltaproteobacteria bacterium]|nr:hypothetical protein [Deltaproteobacteria bacterium]MBW1930162.1 hypothetical protein [Deltaproteobacteria bacterium]MBW2024904.1 hypothetical protein [Deltaproteobacteria bacterium]MBW2124934.1 hypothetical protein [Deltaproteobacteria bacterium]RLB21615.1 MAG: hypothetical protein DRG76_08620 [Deltaproteobacteria bacterium]